MSQMNQNPTISGSLMPVAPTNENGPIDHNVPQPRQPHNIQGLLRFAMDATQSEDAPNDSNLLPLDQERKNFLESALKSMTVDVIESLRKSIKVLLNSDQIQPDDDISEYLGAFETILEHVDMIDTAVDFHKIGGFTIFPPCLTSPHPSIRSNACTVLAECTQHNPYCQQVVCDTDLLEHLLSLLERDCEPQVRVKALYAVSCSVRENTEALSKFTQLQGVKILGKVLKEGEDKAREKAAFLLGRLIAADLTIRDALLAQEIIPTLCHLIGAARGPAHEHLISLLWQLVENNPVALDICTQPELQLTSILRRHLKLAEGDEVMIEEAEHCRLLLKQLTQVLPDPPQTDR